MVINNKEFAKQLEDRTLAFGIEILKISAQLPNTTEGKVIRWQISKAGTSVGANYREANRSRSKADFKSKISICESETSETEFWLHMIEKLNWIRPELLNPIIIESKELLAIFTSTGNTLRK